MSALSVFHARKSVMMETLILRFLRCLMVPASSEMARSKVSSRIISRSALYEWNIRVQCSGSWPGGSYSRTRMVCPWAIDLADAGQWMCLAGSPGCHGLMPRGSPESWMAAFWRGVVHWPRDPCCSSSMGVMDLG